MRRPIYIIKEALANVRDNRTTTLVAVATTAFTLACFGVFMLLYLNLSSMTGSLQGDIKVVLYLQDGVGQQALLDLQRRIKKDHEVASLTYVSKEQALEDFRTQYPNEQRLLQGLGENPLPASLVVTLAPAYSSSQPVKQWADRMRMIPGIAEVQYSQEWIERLNAAAGYFEMGALIIGGILSAATIAIIASTIRLVLYARRDEIEILRLIGAGRTFIRIPYLLEGAVLGTLGGLLALAILRGAFEYVSQRMKMPGQFLNISSTLGFFPFQMGVLMIVGGLCLGVAGSFVSLVELGRAKA
jgi:cell division transport system permease protein